MFKRIQRVFIFEDIYRVDVDSNMVAIGEQAMILFHAMQFSVPISNNTHCYNSGSPKQSPKILSALYAYDGCMGGVNDFSTEEEYMQEIKRFFGSKIMKKAISQGEIVLWWWGLEGKRFANLIFISRFCTDFFLNLDDNCN